MTRSSQREPVIDTDGERRSFATDAVDDDPLARTSDTLALATSRGPTTTVHVKGELLQETVPVFTDVVGVLGDDATIGRLVIDLSPTTFMDSTGLGTLVNLRNQVTGRGARFELVRPDDRVFRLFELTRLDSVFEFVEAP